LNKKVEHFFEEVQTLGFSAIEVSDNLLNWTLADKLQTIQLAVDKYGLKVLGEVGRKDEVQEDERGVRWSVLCTYEEPHFEH